MKKKNLILVIFYQYRFKWKVIILVDDQFISLINMMLWVEFCWDGFFSIQDLFRSYVDEVKQVEMVVYVCYCLCDRLCVYVRYWLVCGLMFECYLFLLLKINICINVCFEWVVGFVLLIDFI